MWNGQVQAQMPGNNIEPCDRLCFTLLVFCLDGDSSPGWVFQLLEHRPAYQKDCGFDSRSVKKKLKSKKRKRNNKVDIVI